MTSRRKTILLLLAPVLALAVVSPLVLRFFFFWYGFIPQNGMYPGLPQGSYFISQKRPYRNIGQIQRGDVVIFRKTDDKGSYDFIWRVVGLPGDDLKISDDAVFLNGKALLHERLRNEGDYVIVREVIGPASYEVAYHLRSDRDEIRPFNSIKVPEDHVFVLGDNRDEAQDSTYVGPIPFSSIIGKKVF
jgi:signal peptidase I